GLFHMIELARHIKRNELDLKIRVVGICNYPEERRQAEKDVAEGQLNKVISFEGWDQYAPWAQIREAYLQADVGLMLADPDPNYVISIPSKFYEYIQYGLPIIASNISLWKDFLDRAGCGWAVDPSDPGEVTSTLSRAEREGLLEATIGAAKNMAARYEWTQMEPILLDAYRQVGVNPL
ncbi:MAG: glycosyltransferase, partial [Rhodothermia bacterium]